MLGNNLLQDIFPRLIQLAVFVDKPVEAKDGFAVAVLVKNLIHPIDFVLKDIPAHIQDDEILSVFGNQVVMPLVVLIAPAVVIAAGIAILAKILVILVVPFPAVLDVVVAGQHPVRKPRVIKDLHGGVRFFPLELLVILIDNIAGVD